METTSRRIEEPGALTDGIFSAHGRHEDDRNSNQLLAAKGIAKAYTRGIWPRRRSLSVLRGADVVLHPGEVVGLVGENGSGKSTLMKILVGSIDRDAGTIARSGSVGYCPQDPILYERLTCNEHFGLFGKAYGMAGGDIETARNQIYETLGFGEWADSRVEELSGGTRAKLNLGLAFAARSGSASPRRALCRFRLGHLPAVLGTNQGTERLGTESVDHQPLHH